MNTMNVISGDERAQLARLITRLQNEPKMASDILASKGISEDVGPAYTIGISGAGGVGKSTLISRMLPVLRKENLRVVCLLYTSPSPRD